MLTFLFTKEYSVVADVPILIFAISPMASFSTSVSNSTFGEELSSAEASFSTDMPFKSAFISSWDNIPSISMIPPL